MNIVLVLGAVFPVSKYGGIERVVWYLAQSLSKQGHAVTLLAKAGSECPFAKVIFIDERKDWNEQIPATADIVHFHFDPDANIEKPVVYTIHENAPASSTFHKNTIFVSQNHAKRYNAQAYVYNGMNWDEYPGAILNNERQYFHFLGAARWRVKNLKGAIKVARQSKQELHVLGGNRLNFSMGFRLTLSPKIKFHGMVDDEAKAKVLNKSRGLIFPVRWNEPFGIAITESLYFGCPIFGTPYGSLPELVKVDVGFLSSSSKELSEQIANYKHYRPVRCYEYARDVFNADAMARQYLEKYEKVLNGEELNASNPKLVPYPEENDLPWR
ncbi:MAG: glycosyltransferase [Cyclobacteriaceae bacterium]